MVDINEIELKDEERQPCEVYTRVMGYIRPSSEFNVGKKSEFKSRKCFTEENAVKRMDSMKTLRVYDCECNCDPIINKLAAE